MITSVNNPEFWDEIYKEKLNRWDLKTPTPVFLELLNKEFFRQKSSLLIAGCGKGYDAFEAAEFGLNVSAVDFSLEEFSDGPPLGMDEQETIKIFSEFLTLESTDRDLNSPKPRKGREILHIYRKDK